MFIILKFYFDCIKIKSFKNIDLQNIQILMFANAHYWPVKLMNYTFLLKKSKTSIKI